MFSTISGHADEHFPFLAQVTRESVNVRAGGNTNYEKIDRLSSGASVAVLGKQYEWYKVQLTKTAQAYIRADYLKIGEGLSAQVVGDKVNVRARASSDASSLGQLPKGTMVNVVEQVNGWCRIEPPGGIYGWIHQDFLTMTSPVVPQEVLAKPAIVTAVPVVLPVVKAHGYVQAVQGSSDQVVYQLIADGQVLYELQEIPDMVRFTQALVDVEGTVAPHSPMHITKITLVL